MNWKKSFKILAIIIIGLNIITNVVSLVLVRNEYYIYEEVIEKESIRQSNCNFNEEEYIEAKNLLLKYSYRYIIFRNKNEFLSKYIPIQSEVVLLEIAKAKMFLAVDEDGYLK